MKKIHLTRAIISSFCIIFFSLVNTARSIAIEPGDKPVSDTVKKAMEQIRAESIRAHTAFLSDDQMEGHRTGTRGYMLAAKYIRSQW